MSVHVGRLETEVRTETESAGPSGAETPRASWERLAEHRRELAHIEQDRCRTAAEGFDD